MYTVKKLETTESLSQEADVESLGSHMHRVFPTVLDHHSLDLWRQHYVYMQVPHQSTSIRTDFNRSSELSLSIHACGFRIGQICSDF
jgi:hypothetical protein